MSVFKLTQGRNVKTEFVRINARRIDNGNLWHKPDKYGKAAACDVLLRLTEVWAVQKAETIPEPACKLCKEM